MVRNGCIGKDPGALDPCCEAAVCGGFAFVCVRRGRVLSRSKTAGDVRRIFRSHGAEEYRVVANRIANTLSKKSVMRAAGP